MANIQDLFTHNRAWAAQMERERPGFFTSLSKQQAPKYMWIGCSDSRVPANQITGLDPGEVFVHRNVANVVVHSDLNALSTIQFSVDVLKVEHVMVVGHYGCGGVQAALEDRRVGLADNWIRHIVDVRDRHRDLLEKMTPERRFSALVELNVIEQVVNVCMSTVMTDAWAKGQKITVHGWAYGVHDGLLHDLHMTVGSHDAIEPVYRAAIAGVVSASRSERPGRTMPMFPQRLDSPLAYDIAKAMLEGFNRHYRLFRTESARAKHRFETADWHGQQRAQRERIQFYDLRVREAVTRLEKEFKAGRQPMDVWQQVKLHYIGLLVDHHQPELAETFFNSVTTKILHRTHFHNDFIFVRPAVSTEYIENDEPAAMPTYRSYYPTRETLHEAIVRIIDNFQLQRPFDDLDRDARRVLEAMSGRLSQVKLRANFQIQVLSSLFYRNKGAYVVGKLINGFNEVPFALPILHDEEGRLFIDACLFGEDDLQMLFSFARAYFMVDMEIPSAYVQFLRSLMPRKPRAEIYSSLGLAKQGKTLFYRDFLYHLKHSSDKFRIAPGIKGMVMLVFDLPSFPYVFKVIKDYYPPQKDTTREQIKGKYLLVKQHDRVGRMADTLEYSEVAFARDRFEDELIEEIRQYAPSMLEISDRDGDGHEEVVIKHLYIERRMIPLNIYLQEAFDLMQSAPDALSQQHAREQIERAVVEYGNAIKDLVAANIFPGDMLWKNFGVTRNGKVVFYDYDEIEYLTDCNFRKVPQARTEEEEMSGEVWYKVGPKDVFPETFGPFLLGNPAVRDVFMKHHADLLDPSFWQLHKERIQRGHVHDVFPYDADKRFAPPQRAPQREEAIA